MFQLVAAFVFTAALALSIAVIVGTLRSHGRVIAVALGLTRADRGVKFVKFRRRQPVVTAIRRQPRSLRVAA